MRCTIRGEGGSKVVWLGGNTSPLQTRDKIHHEQRPLLLTDFKCEWENDVVLVGVASWLLVEKFGHQGV